MNQVIEATFWAHIFLAGDLEQAKQICRSHCYTAGLCVTVEPVTYVYTGGQEEGVRVGLINYPRFPTTPEQLLTTAKDLAWRLREELCQHSFTIMTPTETIFDSRRPA
jgi:hypothetical protein